MYRYSVDNAVTYTSEDVVLFRESPFACWMERLTLENPDHGIPPDMGSLPPGNSMERQDDMADTLCAEGKDVSLIDWDADEPGRRAATLEAMRKGADFIVNAQLALGPLSGTANLLVRTSGYSELGDFLYIPCDTQARTTLNSAFRLCFLADLLHSLQGQLPPQMLIIRGGDDLVPLETESHIYHYRAVKQRFMEAMRAFRKHRMPDPAESSHFGRWSDCAHEVLRQRMLREDHHQEGVSGDEYAEPLRKAVGAAASGGTTAYDLDDTRPMAGQGSQEAAAAFSRAGVDTGSGVSTPTGLTLAEQARMLKPGAYKPGPGVYRLGPPRTATLSPARPDPVKRSPAATGERALGQLGPTWEDAPTGVPVQVGPGSNVPPQAVAAPAHNRRASDAALQNLEFIGSSQQPPQIGPAGPPGAGLAPGASTAPAASLRDPRMPSRVQQAVSPVPAPDPVLGRDTQLHAPDPVVSRDIAWHAPNPVLGSDTPWHAPFAAPVQDAQAPAGTLPADSGRAEPFSRSSAVDMDSTHLASPTPVLTTSNTELPQEFAIDEDDRQFSDSLITSDDYDT